MMKAIKAAGLLLADMAKEVRDWGEVVRGAGLKVD